MKSSDQNQRGASAVEFAIIAPLFIAMLFAIVEFGLIIYAKGMLTHASREGARFGVIYAEPKRTQTEIQAKVREYLDQVGLTSDATVEVIGAGGLSKANLSVTVRYTYQFFVLPRNINDYLAGRMPDLNLTATSVMQME